MQDKEYYSPEGLEKLKKELEERKTVLRHEIAKRIQEAKELGDLSENAEYIEAKEMQSFNESRIGEIEEILKHAEVIAEPKQHVTVQLGSTVKVQAENGQVEEYTIIGSGETDPERGFISNESPLGQAFIDRKAGDEIEVITPRGKRRYRILEVI